MRKVIDYDDEQEDDAGLATDETDEDDGILVTPEYTWGTKSVEAAAEEGLIEYSTRPANVKTWVCSGPLAPWQREDIAIRLTSGKQFRSVPEAREYHRRKFGVVYEDQSNEALGYWAFVLPVLG